MANRKAAHHWSFTATQIMLQCSVDAYGACGSNKKGVHKVIAEKFNNATETIPDIEAIDETKIRNKYDSLRRDWMKWDALINKTGAGWDVYKGTVSGSDEWWEDCVKIIRYLVCSFGHVLFILFGIIGIVALSKETKDDSHESSQFYFMLCAGAVFLQATFLVIKNLWSLENIRSKVAFASLSFEIVIVMIFSFTMSFDEEYQIYLSLLQHLLPTLVIAGGLSLMMLEKDHGKGLNQVEKLHADNNKKIDDRIALLEREKRDLELELLEVKTENEKLVVKFKEMQESMENEIKALTEQSKLMEMEKKRMGTNLVVKRESDELQNENDDLKKELNVTKKELEALTSTHSLQAEKLRKMEDEALVMESDIRASRLKYESMRDEDAKTIVMLKNEMKRREMEVDNVEMKCFELQLKFDDMRKSCIAFQGNGEQASRAATLALLQLIGSVLTLKRKPI